VRGLLRHGKYRASGRSKPASEFLLRAAEEDRFPPINPPVDVNNFVSLASGLPGTIFDLDRSGETLVLRRGRPGESYVFNTTGQSIDLEDLLLLARPTTEATEWGEPCGNPVKDRMDTKVSRGTTRLVAVLYAPREEPRETLLSWAAEYARLLSLWCGARETGHRLVEP
jgi:DNA/RNA-binding domain of Phe-tRNA-synthetase-like protein